MMIRQPKFVDREEEDIEDIHRTLRDAGVDQLTGDHELNIAYAEHEGWPPEHTLTKFKREMKRRGEIEHEEFIIVFDEEPALGKYRTADQVFLGCGLVIARWKFPKDPKDVNSSLDGWGIPWVPGVSEWNGTYMAPPRGTRHKYTEKRWNYLLSLGRKLERVEEMIKRAVQDRPEIANDMVKAGLKKMKGWDS